MKMKTYEIMDLLLLIPLIMGIAVYTGQTVEEPDYANTNAAIFIILVMYMFLGVIPRWLSKMKRSGLKNSLSMIFMFSSIVIVLFLMETLMPGSIENSDGMYIALGAYLAIMMGYAVFRRYWWKHSDHRIGPEGEHGDTEEE